MKVATSEEGIRVLVNKGGAVAVDLYKHCFGDIHQNHGGIKDLPRGCKMRFSCLQEHVARLARAAAKACTWSNVRDCNAPSNLRARRPDETDQSYDAMLCAWLRTKLKNKVQLIGVHTALHSLAGPISAPMAAGPTGNPAASSGMPAYGSGGAIAAVNSASNGAMTASASGIGSPVVTKPATMSQARADIPAGIRTTTPAEIKTTTPAGTRTTTPARVKPITTGGVKTTTPPGSQTTTPAGVKPNTPAGVKAPTTGVCKRASGKGGSSITTGIPKKQKKGQDQAAAEKTGIFHTLFQEYECSLAQKKSKAEFNLNKLSEMKDCLGDLYPEVELVAQRKLEEINNITPGTFRFSTSCN